MAKKTKTTTPFSDEARVITITWEGCSQAVDTKNFESTHEVLGALEYAKAQIIKDMGINN